ncbi:hypothetical protein SAMN04489761_3363, partial [Tenacibaculum sp. MAR_2009_124]
VFFKEAIDNFEAIFMAVVGGNERTGYTF